MMARPLLIFGARTGLGLALARAARAAGWPVRAVVRPGADARDLANCACEIIEADALSASGVETAFAGLPANMRVVSTLGDSTGRADDAGNRHVISAATRLGIPMILVSSLGAGDSRAFASAPLLAAIGPILEAKTRAEEALRASGCDFCIIRPGGLVDDAADSSAAQLSAAQDVHGFIARSDLARLILGLLDQTHLGKITVAAIDPSCPPPARYKSST